MTKLKDYKFYLLIGSTKIKFEAIDTNNEIYFSKKNLIADSSTNESFDLLDQFLKNHIFDIEKNLNNYVKDIHLVIDHNDFLFVNLSHIFSNSLKFISI